MSELAILIDNTTDTFIKRSPYPREDMQPIENLESGLEWLLISGATYPENVLSTQKVESRERVTNSYHAVYTWLRLYEYYYEVVNKTNEELEADLAAIEEILDNKAVKRMLQRTADLVLADEANVTEQDIKDAATLYQQWRPDTLYTIGVKLARGTDLLYEVIQEHTSQSDWLPENLPALYKKFTPAGIIPVWVQPAGAQDAYNINDKVYFPTINDSVYISLIDANVWSPTAYPTGWLIQ